MTLDDEFNYHSSWSRVLEKLVGSYLVKKFPTFYVSLRFITAFTKCLPPAPILIQINPLHYLNYIIMSIIYYTYN